MNPGTTLRIHGGTDAQGAARFDFSTNSNACGPCLAALEAVQAADATRYPDADYTRLRQALADLHGVDCWRIVLAGSASECIFRLTAWVRQRGGSRFWTAPQAYGDYAHAADAWNLQRSDCLDAADLVWACDPSSPLGQAQASWPQWLMQTEPARAERQLLQTVVLDGAYAPLRLSSQPSLNAEQRDRVWQLFSPNKALMLTGIRAGYAVAPAQARQAAHQLDTMAASWAIGTHGEAMLMAWAEKGVQRWLQECLPVLSAWKASQEAMLVALGWTCLPSDAHFFCAQPPAATDVATLPRHLRTRGIKLRDATSLGLPGFVRLSAQPPEAQHALLAALVAVSGRAPAATRQPTLETNQ
jgi:histidinol-phosphate aminotransferase